MALTVLFPSQLHGVIVKNLKLNELMQLKRVSKLWKHEVERNTFLSNIVKIDNQVANLIIDVPRVVIIDKNFSAARSLLIRAHAIYSKPGISLSASKLTLVAKSIDLLGPVIVQSFDCYANWVISKIGSRYRFYFLDFYLINCPDFWGSLVKEHSDS